VWCERGAAALRGAGGASVAVDYWGFHDLHPTSLITSSLKSNESTNHFVMLHRAFCPYPLRSTIIQCPQVSQLGNTS
jgi:hypothetical protein